MRSPCQSRRQSHQLQQLMAQQQQQQKVLKRPWRLSRQRQQQQQEVRHVYSHVEHRDMDDGDCVCLAGKCGSFVCPISAQFCINCTASTAWLHLAQCCLSAA